jgi:hypothetical protein
MGTSQQIVTICHSVYTTREISHMQLIPYGGVQEVCIYSCGNLGRYRSIPQGDSPLHPHASLAGTTLPDNFSLPTMGIAPLCQKLAFI